MYWTVEWVFASQSGPEFKITDTRIRETETIADVLQKKIHADEMDVRLKPFALSVNDLIVLLRHDASEKFHIVDQKISLSKSLAGKSVIDFPTFVVTHKDNRHLFQLFEDRKQRIATSTDSSASSSDGETGEEENEPAVTPVQTAATITSESNGKKEKEEGECSSSDESES